MPTYLQDEMWALAGSGSAGSGRCLIFAHSENKDKQRLHAKRFNLDPVETAKQYRRLAEGSLSRVQLGGGIPKDGHA